jgi:hypothetical protein
MCISIGMMFLGAFMLDLTDLRHLGDVVGWLGFALGAAGLVGVFTGDE